MAREDSGADGRRIYLDAIEEALSKPRAPGRQRTYGGRRRTYDIAKKQLSLVERQQRRLAASLRELRASRCEECKRRVEISAKDMPAIAMASDVITKQIVALVASIRAAHEAEDTAMAALPEEQMRAVLKREIQRLEISEAEWHAIVSEKWGPDVADVLMKS